MIFLILTLFFNKLFSSSIVLLYLNESCCLDYLLLKYEVLLKRVDTLDDITMDTLGLSEPPNGFKQVCSYSAEGLRLFLQYGFLPYVIYLGKYIYYYSP